MVHALPLTVALTPSAIRAEQARITAAIMAPISIGARF